LQQAILFEEEQSDDELYCVGKLKTGAPKFYAALNFLWLLSLFQDKEINIDFGRAKEMNKS
jgi:hypothetical protein